MLLTVGNKFCLENFDRLTDGKHFTNQLPLSLVVDDPISGTPSFYIQLEAISVEAWPEVPFLILCNLAESQPCGGRSMENILAMANGFEKFSRPKVPVRAGRFSEVEIQLKTCSGEVIKTDNVVVQMSIHKNE